MNILKLQVLCESCVKSIELDPSIEASTSTIPGNLKLLKWPKHSPELGKNRCTLRGDLNVWVIAEKKDSSVYLIKFKKMLIRHFYAI